MRAVISAGHIADADAKFHTENSTILRSNSCTTGPLFETQPLYSISQAPGLRIPATSNESSNACSALSRGSQVLW